MATALSTLRGYVRDEIGELTAGRWSDSQLNSWLNRGITYSAAELHRGKAYPMLQGLLKYVTYTLSTSYQEYTFWDVINNSMVSSPESSTNTWFAYVHGSLDNYPLEVATQEEWHRLNATTGEHAPSTTQPYIYFSGKDRTTKFLTYTSGSTEPAQDGKVIGATGAAEALIAVKTPPQGGTWSGGDAAGDLYIYDDTGTFESENLNYQAPKGSTTTEDIATIAAAATASVHDCPLFQIWPVLTSSATMKLWWLNKAGTLSAATDTSDLPVECDEMLVLFAAARAWKADRNFDMFNAYWQEFQQELVKKVDTYRQVHLNWL